MGVKQVELAADEILSSIDDAIGRNLTQKILSAFDDNGLTYKIRTAWKPKNTDEKDYRIFCYVKKSKEALIINTRDYDFGCFSMQLRITDKSTFEHLDEYSENVRNGFLNGGICRAPNCSNDGSEYVFTYQGETYRKCHMLCGNFWFRNLCEEDLNSIMHIIDREIAFGMPKRR